LGSGIRIHNTAKKISAVGDLKRKKRLKKLEFGRKNSFLSPSGLPDFFQPGFGVLAMLATAT
jgi:hypothetical protein